MPLFAASQPHYPKLDPSWERQRERRGATLTLHSLLVPNYFVRPKYGARMAAEWVWRRVRTKHIFYRNTEICFGKKVGFLGQIIMFLPKFFGFLYFGQLFSVRNAKISKPKTKLFIHWCGAAPRRCHHPHARVCHCGGKRELAALRGIQWGIKIRFMYRDWLKSL